jgi:uncharacterized UPF0160 family protein
MEFDLNGKFFRSDDIDAIYNELSSMSIPTITNEVKQRLVKIFSQTDNDKIRDKIALIFADLRDRHIVPVLINKINEIKYSKHISTLIYACSEYDCAEWIVFFVSLVIDLDDSSYLEAISVIEEIHAPIKLSDKIICVKRLTDYLTAIDNGSEKYEDVEGLLELIESLEIA